MPESPKKVVYTGEPTITPYPVTQESKEAVLDKTLSNIVAKSKQGAATKEEIDFYNYNAKLAQNFTKELDLKLAKADDYTSKIGTLFNKDFEAINDPKNSLKLSSIINSDSYYQSLYGVQTDPEGFKNLLSKGRDLFEGVKNSFITERNSKISQVNEFIKNKDFESLYKLSDDLVFKGTDRYIPTEATKLATDKASSYVKLLADTIKTETSLEWQKAFLDPKDPIKSALNNPTVIRELGRDLYSKQVGSELYNPEVSKATEFLLEDKEDNPIDYKASQLAINSLKSLATLQNNRKIAEYARLKLNAEKIGDPTKIKEAEQALQEAQKSLNEINDFDSDKYLKTNFKDTYFSIKDDEEQAARRREGVKYWKDTSPIISGALSILPVDPVKGYYTAKATGKALYNNLVNQGLGINSAIWANDAEAAALGSLTRFDKTGYTIGIDEEGKPVESSRFHWVDKAGKHHFNGYATVEAGVPVAYQMLETIAIAEAGGAALGLLGRLGTGALKYGGAAAEYALGAERIAAAGERLTATGGKLLETPYLGRGLKGVGTAAEKTAEVISSPAVLDRLRTFGSVYATTYPRVYMEELNNFKKGEDAQNVARWRAAVESLSESIVPNTPDLFKAGAKSLFPFKAASYARDLSAGLDGVVLGMAPGISNKLLNRVVNSAITKRALGMAGDVFQEGVIEEEASLIGNHFVDQLAKSKNAEYVAQNDLTWKNIMDTAIESVAAMALTAPFMGGGTKRAREQANTEAIISSRWNIANNPEAYKSYIKSQLDKGEITQEQAVQKVAKIDQYAKALENLPIRNLSSIRDMATLLENKDAQYQFFSNHLKKEALLDYTPTEEELPEYTKELERLDGELYKTQQLASKYDSLSLEDKKEIIYNNYKNKYSNIVDRDDVSPIAITAELLRAQKDLTTKKGRIYSKELEGYVNDLGASMDAVKSKFQSFIKNNNEGLTSEQLQYKYELVNVNKDFFAEEEMEDMFDTLGRVAAATYGPLFEIKDENEFIEALARNYVTADTNKRPLTTNDGELLYGQIQEKYVNDYLFNDFIKDLPKEEAAKKNEELKNRFWTRVVELKQDLQKGQVFPGVANTPLTPEQQEAQQAAKAAEVAPKYKDFVDQYRVAAERSLGEEMLDIQEDAVNELVKEDNLEGVIAGLASLQSVFIKENFQKIAEDLRAGKTESLVNFLTENGIAPEVIDNLVSKIAPKAEAKPEGKKTSVFDVKRINQFNRAKEAGLQRIKNSNDPQVIFSEINRLQEALKNTKGAELTPEEQNFIDGKLKELKDKGYTFRTKKGEILREEETVIVGDNIRYLEPNEVTEEQRDLIQKELTRRKKLKQKLIDNGYTEEEATNQAGLHPNDTIRIVVRDVKVTLLKDGVQEKAGEVAAVFIDIKDAESVISKKAPQAKPKDQIEADLKAKKEEIEKKRKEELDSLGQRQLAKRFEDLAEAKDFKDIAKAIVDIEQNVKQGAKLSPEQKKQLDKAKEQLKKDGYEIINYNVVRNGDNTIVQNVDFYDNETDVLTEEQAKAIESRINTLEKRGEEVDVADLPSPVSRTIKPLIQKDGKMVQAAEVTTLTFESVEQAKEAVRKSREANFKKPTVAEKINNQYNKQLADVLQQEVDQLGKMMFDFTPEEQRILKEFEAKVPTETTVSPESLFEPVTEPLTFSAEEQAHNEQAQERQEIEQNVIIEDIRPNYVYLGVTDTSIENKTRLTDQNTAFVFNFIDTIDQSVNSADMRSLGYSMVMHSAREILNRAGLDIQPKETFEEYKEQFKVNGISVLPETQIAEFFKNNNYLDRIKLGIVTDKEGKPLLFDKYGTQTTVGTPVITALGQVYGEGKKLDSAFKASMPAEAVIAPLSKFINGRTIDKKPISVKESNNLIMHNSNKIFI